MLQAYEQHVFLFWKLFLQHQNQPFFTVNDLLAMQAHSREITINVQDIVAALMKKGVSKKDIIENNWLDIQGIYSTVGWNVEYDCPGFDENYPSRYIFTPKRSR